MDGQEAPGGGVQSPPARSWIGTFAVLVVVALGLCVWLTQTEAGRRAGGIPEPEAAAVETARVGGIAPAPTVFKWQAVHRGVLMSVWIVSGAGDETYNGTYAESGTYNGQPAYTNGSRWLFLCAIGWWVLDATKSEKPVDNYPYYGPSIGTIAGEWQTEDGTPPAPTVAAGGTLPNWPWDWWWDGPFFGWVSRFAPCAAKLNGAKCLVLPADNYAVSKYGFIVFDLTARTFDQELTAASLFGGLGETPAHQGAGCFDIGDGATIAACSGPMEDDESGWCFHWGRYTVVPGNGTATELSTKTVNTRGQDFTPLVETAAGAYCFLECYDGAVYFNTYADNADSYTEGTPVALPALPSGYSDVRCDTGGPLDQVLFVYDGTTYWMRHVANSTPTHRLMVYEVSDGVVTPVADVLTLMAPSQDTYLYTQTWAEDPIRGNVWALVGARLVSQTCQRWTPGSNGENAFNFLEDPAERGWYVTGGDGVLYLMGWVNENEDFRAFVIDTTPVPTVMEELDGIVRTVGTATLQSMTPVEPEVDGVVRTIGTVTLQGGPSLVEGEGVVRLVGTATLESVTEAEQEGPGAKGEMVLTPGVWPGAARRVTLPAYFDRSRNRRYGGSIGNRRPAWHIPVDANNALEQYVKFWSWCAENPSDYTIFTDNSGVTGDGTMSIDRDSDVLVSGCTVTAVNQVYRRVRGDDGWWGTWWVSEDGLYEMASTGEGCTIRVVSGSVTVLVVTGSPAYAPPWRYNWSQPQYYPSWAVGPAMSVTQVTGTEYDHWRAEGVEPEALGPSAQRPRLSIPYSTALVGPYTVLCDYTPLSSQGTMQALFYQADATWSRTLSLHQTVTGDPLVVRFVMRNTSGAFDGEEVYFDTDDTYASGDRQRVVLSVDESQQASLYLDGQAVGSAQDADFAGWPPVDAVNMAAGSIPYVNNGYLWQLSGIMHEFGFLDGYAATAEDVRTNPALSMRYGMRGAPTPVTDLA